MDFKQFLEQIKGLTDPAIFAIIAKFAIGFYFLKLLFKGFKEFLKFIFAVKEKKDNYKDLQKTNLENKKDIKELKEAFQETHKLIRKIEEDLSFLNAYRDIKHDKDEETVEARKTMKLVLEKLTTNNK